MWEYVLFHASMLYVIAFTLIWYCDKGSNRPVWAVLAVHAVANLLFNIYAYQHLEFEPFLFVAYLTTGDMLVIMFLRRIPGDMAKAQTLLVSIALAYQWISLCDLEGVLFRRSDPLMAIYEPLILAIGICQLVLGSNAISEAISRLLSPSRGNDLRCVSNMLRGSPFLQKIQAQDKK